MTLKASSLTNVNWTFLLKQNLSPNDIAGSDVTRWKFHARYIQLHPGRDKPFRTEADLMQPGESSRDAFQRQIDTSSLDRHSSKFISLPVRAGVLAMPRLKTSSPRSIWLHGPLCGATDPGWAASWPWVTSCTHCSKDVIPSLTCVRSSCKSAIACSHNCRNCSASTARHLFLAARVCDSSVSASILAESSDAKSDVLCFQPLLLCLQPLHLDSQHFPRHQSSGYAMGSKSHGRSRTSPQM